LGEEYSSKEALIEGVDLFGNIFNPWIADTFPIWKKEVCDKNEPNCTDGQYQMIKSGSRQELIKGYITEDDIAIDRYKIMLSTPTFTEGDVVESISFNIAKGRYVEVYSNVFNHEQTLNMYTSRLKTY
jgi:hypothetical protein